MHLLYAMFNVCRSKGFEVLGENVACMTGMSGYTISKSDVLFVISRQSPMTRRLSTLVEEGSDAEADESLTQGHPSPKHPLRSPPSYAASHASSRSPKSSARSTTTEDVTKTPPRYRNPPKYKEVVYTKRDERYMQIWCPIYMS